MLPPRTAFRVWRTVSTQTIGDARKIRTHILDNLEIASLPTTTEEERNGCSALSSAAVVPTGVETAAEISDMINEDVFDYFPKVLRSQAQVHLIQSREHILNTYSEKIPSMPRPSSRAMPST